MKFLILTKLKFALIDKGQCPKSVEEYILFDDFFYGMNKELKNLGHTTLLSWEESFFVPQFFALRFRFLSRAIKFLIRKIGLIRLDRFLFSKKIIKICRENGVDVIFTEINAFISPAVIKAALPKIKISQWYGIFPEMSDKDTLEILAEYDYIWLPCEFDRQKVSFKGIEKSHYIGCFIDPNLYFFDYDPAFAYDVVFIGGVGGGHSNRIEILEEIAQNFPNFAFYGYGLNHIPHGFKLREKYRGFASIEVLRKTLSSSKIAINLTLDGYERISRGFNARLFEIAQIGGALQLCKYDEKIKEFFEIGRDLDTFIDTKEAIEKIKFYLANPSVAKELAKNAKANNANNTSKQKAQKICQILES